MEKMGAPAQQLVVNEVAQEGAVGTAGLAHEASRGKIISLILQQVEQFREEFLPCFKQFLRCISQQSHISL